MTGRPSDLTPELAERICSWLEEGNSLRSLCEQDDMPAYGSIMRWLREEREPFCSNYARARESQAHNDGDRMNQIVMKLEAGAIDPNVARVMIDALKWTAGKRLPKSYGDKVQIGGDTDGAPIVVTWAKPT